MVKAILHRDNEEQRPEERPVLALLANGSSGRWTVTLDESTKGAEEWILQIEGPSLHLCCEVDGPHCLHELATFLDGSKKNPDAFVIGRVDRVPLRLLWDVEEERVLCVTVGPVTRPLVRCSLPAQEVQALAEATQQAALDL